MKFYLQHLRVLWVQITEGNGPVNGLDFVTALGSSTTFNPDGDADAATSTTVYVKFYEAPAAGNVYAIQVSEFEGEDGAAADAECISIRRVYVSLFDFEVDVYFCTSTGDTTGIYAGTASDGNMAFKNNWDNSIIQNSLSAAWLNANNPALDTLNNDVSAYGKGDTIYYAVEVEFTGLPSDYDLNQIDWRYRYSFPTNGFSLNRINALALFDGATDTPTFNGESDTESSWGDDASGNPIYNGELTFPLTTDYSEQNCVSVPLITAASDSKHSAKYVFEVALHKDFPETVDNQISVSIDEVQLRMGGTEYNDGTKDNDGLTTNDIDLLDGATGIQTIYSNPSTSVITITR